MRASRVLKALAASTAIAGGLAAAYVYAVTPHYPSVPPKSAEGLLDHADRLAWGNRWAEAVPLYQRADRLFLSEKNGARALYAEVSELPADESLPIPSKILRLKQDLTQAGAQDPETRLRVLTILGMTETNFDASDAKATWDQVRSLALELHQVKLATRAEGEQGIAIYILGDQETAKKQVVRAWMLAKLERDPAAVVRYASLYGAGAAEGKHYQQALKPLDDAIKMAAADPDIAYPTIAVNAKIESLAGLNRTSEALALANDSLTRLNGTRFDGERSQVYISRGETFSVQKDWPAAIVDYTQAIRISQRISNYRGITDAAGLLAQAYEQAADLPDALKAIKMAIDANTHIPDELYLVPRNLAIQAEITSKMGDSAQSDAAYRKAIALVDVLLQHAATVDIQRALLSATSDIYSGYFSSLCDQRRYDEALQVLEKARGRIETDALEHHSQDPVHPPTHAEVELTRLNIALINTDNPAQRVSLTNQIYSTELRLSPSALAQATMDHPVHLSDLQSSLNSQTVIVEYVLAEPSSYALAITQKSITPYRLPSKRLIEADSDRYRHVLEAKGSDEALAHRIFSEVLGPVRQYHSQDDLVIVPDGSLHLLPFSALRDDAGYVLQTHTVAISPSSTVYKLLRERQRTGSFALPYVGVAAWTQPADGRNALVRAVTGPEKSQLLPLPESKREVETIAGDLPKPSTILLGAEATESHFKHLPLDRTGVVHLALHGYADLEYPDRSALVFAPEPSGDGEDGLLQVREIRKLHLNAKLVTLSACDTGVGPIGEPGVANLVNAFIEAGADSVVSTLWELEDHSTEHLMASFYNQLSMHQRKVQALRSAQLELLATGLAPYYWAGFQIVGDPNGTLD